MEKIIEKKSILLWSGVLRWPDALGPRSAGPVMGYSIFLFCRKAQGILRKNAAINVQSTEQPSTSGIPLTFIDPPVPVLAITDGADGQKKQIGVIHDILPGKTAVPCGASRRQRGFFVAL